MNPPRCALVLSLLCLLFTAGCADVERETAPTRPDRPEPGRALVIFYRARRYEGSMRGIEVTDNGRAIGDLGNGTYFVYQAAPGMHHFSSNGHDEDAVSYPLAPNRTYYFRCGIAMGMWLPHYPVESVMEEQARAEMGDLQRVRWNGH